MAKKKNNILADFVDGFKKALNNQQQQQTQQQTTQQLPTKNTWQQAQQKREAVANSILSPSRTNMMATATTAERLKNKGSFLNGLNLPTRTISQKETINNGMQRAVNIRNSTPEEERKKEEEQIRKQEQLKQQQNNNNNDYQVGGTFKNVVNQASKEEQKETKTGETIEKKENNLPTSINSKIFNAQNLQEAENDVEKRFLDTMENVTNATENTLLGAAKGLKDAGEFTVHLANYPYDKARQLGLNIGSKITGKTFEDDGDYSQIGIMKKTIPEDSFARPLVNKLSETKDSITGKINEKSKGIDTYLDTNIAKNIEETNDPIAKKITEIAPSIGQQLPATVLGPEYFFLSSGGSYYKDALTRGMNKDQATIFGVVMGTVEGLTEKIQFGKLANTGKNIMSGGTIKQAFKDYGLNVADNMVQEGITEPITEFAAQTIGGKDKADWNNIGKRMWEAAVDGGISSLIMDAGFSGVSSANRIIEKMENNEKISNEELKETLQDIQASGKVDVNQSLQNSFNKVTNSIRDALYSKGIDSTSALDKARNIDEAYKTNLTSEIQKALNDGKLNKDTYSELNKQLDQISQLKNSEELLNRAKDLDDTLELTDTDNSLSNVVEKLTSEAKLDNETYDKLKGIFDNIDNNMPYVAETSENKKIDTFRDDMTNFMNNSVQSHNFAKSVESIIEKTGLNIRLNNQLADNENGRIFNENGETTIEINPNSQSAGEFVLMHELTHAIGNQDLKQTILDYAKKNTEFETALKDLEARYGQNDVTEEVMADISGQLLGNEEFINSLAQEQPSKFKQIYNAVKSWVKKFTGTYGYEDFIKDVEIKWRKAYEQNKNNITENIDQKVLNNKTPLEEIPLFSKSAKSEQERKNSYNIPNDISIKDSQDREIDHDIHTYSTAAYSDQVNMVKEFQDEDGNTISKIDYSIYDGDIYIDYIETQPEYRRKGLAKRLLLDLQQDAKEENQKIHYGYSSEEGTAFLNSVNNIDITDSKESESNSDSFNLPKNVKEIKNLNEFLRNNIKIEKNETWKSRLEGAYTANRNILGQRDAVHQSPLSYKRNIIQQYLNYKNRPTIDNKGRNLSKQQQEYFQNVSDKLRDENGNLKTYYHGTQRADRVGNVFDPQKATSGPMAFFTDNSDIAKSYSESKSDTSLSRDYTTEWDLFKSNGQDLDSYWRNLSYEKKQEMREKGYNIGFDDDYELRFAKNASKESFGDHYGFELKTNGNNAIKALYDTFINSGFWMGEDIANFQKVLDYIGVENLEYLDPYKVDSKTYEVYLDITNPFDTSEMSQEMLDKLEKASKKVKYNPEEAYSADMWDKTNISPSDWIEYLKEDIENGTTHSWTRIPDWVTDMLKSEGYDGIVDTGGKNGGVEHQVAIPFYSEQIKNVDNTKPTINKDIRYSKQTDKWQEWLEKNFPSRGTTTKFSDILLPNANIQNNNTQTNIKPASDSVINKIEQGLKNIYPVDLDNEQLKEIATNMANNPTEEGILEALKDYRTTYIEDESSDNNIIKEIKSTIRNTKLDVSNLKRNITDYNDTRKANFGKLKLGNDGLSVDSFYQELSNNYPEYFDKEIANEADQLNAIIDFINQDYETKTEYQMTDEDIINSGLIDAVTTALNTEQTETIKETPKEAVKGTTENDLIKRNKELYKQRYNLEKEAQRLDRKIELTDNEKGIVKSLLNGDITIDEIPTRYAEHKDSIIQKYQNDKALNEVRSEIKKNKEQSKSVYNTTADEVVKNLSKFKDKSKGILYRRETAIRNIQDVVKDKVLADKINNTYFKPVLENEAARTRYINDNMQKINDLKIDTKKTYPYNNPMVDKNGKKYMENLKINEADIAGLYLEKKISDDYLTKNHIDKARIEKIADTFKSILDDGINNMETEVMKAGYAPIGRIENYFPHFMETRPDGLIGKISNFIGIRTKVKSLPTEIAGKTDTFRPGKTWNQNALHREGDITDINALKAMENYINGASDVIYHTDDIQKLRALERSIRESYSDEATKKTINNILKDSELTFDEKEEAIYNKLQNVRTEIPNFVTWLTEYTNILANKKSQSDRSMEYNWGRQTYTTMQDIESKIASNMIGGNLSVSLTNFAPLSQAMGTTKVGNVLIGMLETTQNTIKNVFGNGDNFVDSSDFLTRRRGTETIHKLKASEKVSKVLGKPMEIIDNFTSEAIVRAKYRENIQNGMTEMEALKSADEYTANLMADRSKGALPTLFNSKNPISKLVTMFQVEPNNMLSNYTKDWRNYNGNKAVAIAKLTAASYAFNTILKSLRGGSDILPDPINIVSQLIKMMTSDDEEEKKKAQDELISSITGSIPFGTSAVVLGQALGIDMPDSVQNSGRMPIASAIPNWKNIVSGAKSDSPEYRNQQFYKEFMKPLLYLGLPTGGAQINKTIEGLKAYEKGGSYKYNSKGEKLLQFPVKQNMTNLIKSATFGKYSTPEGQEYATNFDAFNAKQTKLYDETDIDYKDLKKYYKDTKGQKDLAKMQYVDDMNISDDDKVELYKSDILSEKQAENLDYALDHKITTKKTFDDEYQKLQEKNISLPTKEDYQMMNSADISLKNYSDYKVATKGLKTEAEKNKALRNLSCSSKTKQAIYENTTGKDDETYQSVKNVISINNYLDYKSQKFVADKDENGKAISGSRKQKLIDYLNSNRNMNYQEKLIILGMNNKLSSGELTVVFNYVNSQKLTAKQKIAILKKVKGFKINGNNISW